MWFILVNVILNSAAFGSGGKRPTDYLISLETDFMIIVDDCFSDGIKIDFKWLFEAFYMVWVLDVARLSTTVAF